MHRAFIPSAARLLADLLRRMKSFYIPHIGTNSHFLNAWKFSVIKESSSFLCVVCVCFRQSVIASRNSAKLG
jgi:hypothetical protein